MVGFCSFDQLIAYLLIFFNWCYEVGLFFLPIIFFFIPQAVIRDLLSLNSSRVSFFFFFVIVNVTRMLRAILNKSWRQHPTRHQLYGHLPPITKTIQVRRTRHAGHCWRSRDELIRDVLLWTPTHGRAKAGQPARTYIQQLCEDTGCCPEDLPRAMNDVNLARYININQTTQNARN